MLFLPTRHVSVQDIGVFCQGRNYALQVADIHALKVRGYVTHVKGWTFKVYSISTRLRVNITYPSSFI